MCTIDMQRVRKDVTHDRNQTSSVKQDKDNIRNDMSGSIKKVKDKNSTAKAKDKEDDSLLPQKRVSRKKGLSQ